jgi:hypothetical protein
MEGHRARVGCMAWSSHLLSTGSRDKTILQRDVRAPEHWTSRLAAHRSEVHSPGGGCSRRVDCMSSIFKDCH